jgi:hypothetical protein
MDPEYETCRANFELLAAYYVDAERNRNEATTRLQLIDRLFFECLGWSREANIELEQSQDGEYADYTFLAPRRIMIVEAKREGKYFEVPAGNERLVVKLVTICRDNADLRAAVEQAMSYCQRRGVPIGVVANGHQLIAFLAVRTDGIAPMEGQAMVFPSFEFMSRNFLQLWQALSRPGIEGKYIQTELVGNTIPELPPKLATRIYGYPGIKARNIFQTDLQIMAELVVEDITRAPELEKLFLTECYCDSGALSQHSLISKAILEARYAALFDSELGGPTLTSAKGKKGISPDLLAESLSRRPILLIGDVGAGKTIFIKHLINVAAIETFAHAIDFHLDLGFGATLSASVKDFVLHELARQMETKHGVDPYERNFVYGVYDLDLKKFAKGIYGELSEVDPNLFKEKQIGFLDHKLNDSANHLQRCFMHLTKARNKQIVIFIDNCDQRDDEIQQQAFLVAQELAANWPVTVFVTLRPETFYRSMKTGALTGYHPKAFTISPPRVDLVVEKRLKFGLKLTAGEIPISSLPIKMSVTLTRLDAVIRVFLNALEQMHWLRECLDNISGGNVRRALDIVKEFFGSGHVDTEKIVKIFSQTGRYHIPQHEFLRAVIYGDAVHYNPEKSPVANIFDVSYADPREHFLMPLLLAVLTNASGIGVDDGFVETARVYEHLQGLGFVPDQIDACMVRAHRFKLLEFSARRVPQQDHDMPHAVRATSIGAYHLKRLCGMFTYLDAMVVDTPIFDPNMRGRIGDVKSIGERLKRGRIFRQYLDRQWVPFHRLATGLHWSALSEGIEKDIADIEARLTNGRQGEFVNFGS